VGVAVTSTGVFVGVGVLSGGLVAVGVKVDGSVVGVSAEGPSWASTIAGRAANDKSIISSKATRTPKRTELDRFIERFLLIRTGA
jgi:hypothetical protein